MEAWTLLTLLFTCFHAHAGITTPLSLRASPPRLSLPRVSMRSALFRSSYSCCCIGSCTLTLRGASARTTLQAPLVGLLRSSFAGRCPQEAAFLPGPRGACTRPPTHPLRSYGCSKATAGLVFWIPKLIWWCVSVNGRRPSYSLTACRPSLLRSQLHYLDTDPGLCARAACSVAIK